MRDDPICAVIVARDGSRVTREIGQRYIGHDSKKNRDDAGHSFGVRKHDELRLPIERAFQKTALDLEHG